jgi:hypothetical protein
MKTIPSLFFASMNYSEVPEKNIAPEGVFFSDHVTHLDLTSESSNTAITQATV